VEYLESGEKIKERLNKLFSGDGKKWAIVAFVGRSPLDHLPENVSNLKVVCWPQAGATDPAGIRSLLERDIPVYFCDRLHQKVYYCERTGLIVGSANLSNNAMNPGRLHEFAVYVDDPAYDITKHLASISVTERSRVTQKSLDLLQSEHHKYIRALEAALEKPPKTRRGKSSVVKKFEDWFTSDPRQPWKISTWEEEFSNEEEAKVGERLKPTTGQTKFYDFQSLERTINVGEFVLSVPRIGKKISKRNGGNGLGWLLVDKLMQSPDGNRKYRLGVQLRALSDRTPPPFSLDGFSDRFAAAFDELGEAKAINKDCSPTAALLEAIS